MVVFSPINELPTCPATHLASSLNYASNRLIKPFSPLHFLETDNAPITSDSEGTLDQVAVYGKKLNGLLIGHIGEFFF